MLLVAASVALLGGLALLRWHSPSSRSHASLDGIGSWTDRSGESELVDSGTDRNPRGADFPTYPGAKVVLDRADLDSRVVHAETRESFESIFGFYRRELKKAGWTTMPAQASKMPKETYQRGDEQVMIEIQPAIRDEKLIKLVWRRLPPSESRRAGTPQ